MFSLVALLVVSAAPGLLDNGTGPFRLIIPLLACICIPWAAWVDVSGQSSAGMRTPFLAAVVFAVAAPLYFGLLPANLAWVLAHGQGAAAPVRFAAEFGLMMFAPFGLMAAPAVRLFIGGPVRREFGALPATSFYQALAVLMAGVFSLIFVASAGIGGIGGIADDPVSGIWRESVQVMVPIWYIGMLLSVFALAWGQLGDAGQ